MVNKNIKLIRLSKNLSIEYVAKKIGMFKKSYIALEKGAMKVDDKILYKISKFYNLTIDEIKNWNQTKENLLQKEIDNKNLIFSEKGVPPENSNTVQTNKINKSIKKKPYLLNISEIEEGGVNVVGSERNPQSSAKNISTPRLLNYVEPYLINGVEKTLFYSEFNTNLNVGDKVFIIGGYYDSNKIIENNEYSDKTDGYEILFIDKCKIVLDIDYENQSPYIQNKIDDFIHLSYIENQEEFNAVNKEITTKNERFDYKFNPNNGNLIWTDKDYEGIPSEWGKNEGLTGSPGFFIKNGTASWRNVTPTITNGSFEYVKPDIAESLDKILVRKGSFTCSVNNNSIYFNENSIYKWGVVGDVFHETYSTWVIDTEYMTPFIAKSNFRGGNFKGEFNGGLYGQETKQITWNGDNADWNLGTLFNIFYKTGYFNSQHNLPFDYKANVKNGEIVQNLNSSDNDGKGYNFIYDSFIKSINFVNGSIYNSVLNSETSDIFLEKYSMGETISSDIQIQKSYISNSVIKNSIIDNSEIQNSFFKNSKLEKVKSNNSSYQQSIFKNSIYLNNENIEIMGYDEFIMAEDKSIEDTTHKVYKFYITEENFRKLKRGDYFYIKDLKIESVDKYPIHLFNRKFRFSSWVEYFDINQKDINNPEKFIKNGVQVGAFLSNNLDNSFTYNVVDEQPPTTKMMRIENSGYSIDIVISTHDIQQNEVDFQSSKEFPDYGLNLNNDRFRSTDDYHMTNKIRDIVDYKDAYIISSNFESGLFEYSDWINGDHINYNNDTNITKDNNGEGYLFNIVDFSTQSHTLTLKTTEDPTYKETQFDFFDVGNIIYLNNIDNQGLNLPSDTYKIINKDGDELEIEEIYTTYSYVENLTDINNVSIGNAYNRYNYIHGVKFKDSYINSGMFRRSYFRNCFIENQDFNTKDITFKNLTQLKNNLISDSIFKDNKNTLSKFLYMNSHFARPNNNEFGDEFKNGIVYNSTWGGLTFYNGVFKESMWDDGYFIDGLFYDNRSFNASPTEYYKNENNNNIKSYYKNGSIGVNEYNNRHSWRRGEFGDGEFFKSDWESGKFKNGKFYYSKFYSGDIQGGVLGDKNIDFSKTVIYNSIIEYVEAENAYLYAHDCSYDENRTMSVIWKDGKFNGGEISTDYSQTNSNSFKWENGEFNGGKFNSMAVWEDGIFNEGFFISSYGYTMSSSTSSGDYSWQNGKFKNGVFGNGSYATNSTWYNGRFHGGKFIGKIWNDGYFFKGVFKGGSTYSAIGGNTPSLNALDFVDSYTLSFYGLWRNGTVSNSNDIFSRKWVTDILKTSENKVEFKDMLWEDGLFNHKNGSFINSVWLKGRFENGEFYKSSFNPFVKRNDSLTQSFELSDECYWKNGKSVESDFYISKWENGIFDKGNMWGVIWKYGDARYMNAYNIFWEDGRWRNGNWYGSYINYDGSITNDFHKQILERGASWSGTYSMHVWNIFDDVEETGEEVSYTTASTPIYIETGGQIDLGGSDGYTAGV